MAAGNRRGLAQSIFQVGGNFGSSIGPLLAALIIEPYGQGNILWFSLLAFAAIIILSRLGFWYRSHLSLRKSKTINTSSVQLSKGKNCKQRNCFISIDLFEVFLPRFHDELLHVLPDS